MRKEISSTKNGRFQLDTTPRYIKLTWKEFEIICEALNDREPIAGKSAQTFEQEKLNVSRSLVEKWKEQDK